MKNHVLATCLLASSILPAAVIRSHAEDANPAPGASIAPSIDVNGVSGVMWAQRNISTFVLTTQSAALGTRSYSADSYVQDTAFAIASGGYNLFTTSSTQQQSSSSSTLGFNVADDGPVSNYWAPGALLSEWNPVPVVEVVNLGIPAIDDYPRNFTPGGLLVGFGDDFQFTLPNLLLAGGSQAPPPTLNPLGLALRGVSPETFGGAPSTVRTAPIPAVASTEVPVGSTGNSAPVPQTIATVAEAFMTTTVTSTTLSPATRADGLPGNPPNLIGNAAELTDSPEPGSIAAMGLGLTLVAWKLHSRKQQTR